MENGVNQAWSLRVELVRAEAIQRANDYIQSIEFNLDNIKVGPVDTLKVLVKAYRLSDNDDVSVKISSVVAETVEDFIRQADAPLSERIQLAKSALGTATLEYRPEVIPPLAPSIARRADQT